MRHIIEDFKPAGGEHCITNALKQVFDYYHCPLSEAMLFGIGSGLAFTYINLANSPMVFGRTKPIEFEQKLAERLMIQINCHQPKNYEVSFTKTKKLLQQDHPVLIYADMPFMKYLGMNPSSHFGGHAVVLFGYDEEQEVLYVSDRDHSDFPIRTPKGPIASEYHLVSYQEMAQARSSKFRPFPANNKYLTFDMTTYEAPNSETLTEAIRETCESMLNPPAKLLGINGITKFSQEIVKWRTLDQKKLKTAGITNYFQISKDGGTGGGIFRKMYGEFLIEAAHILTDKEFTAIGNDFIKLAEKWDLLAGELWKLGKTGDPELLKPLSEQIAVLGTNERKLLERLECLVDLNLTHK